MNWTPSSWETNSETILCGWVVWEQTSLKCHWVPCQLSYWVLCWRSPYLSTFLSDVRKMRSLTRGSEHQGTQAGPSHWEETHHPSLGQNIEVETRALPGPWGFLSFLDVFLDLFFSFFREPTRWELQRSIYLSEEIPKVVVPRKRTDLVKQCTQGSSK